MRYYFNYPNPDQALATMHGCAVAFILLAVSVAEILTSQENGK